jgi:hypothetical protein
MPTDAAPSTVPPAPAVPDEALVADVDDEQVAFFRTNGYVAIDRITVDEEVEWLREIFDMVFSNPSGGMPGGYYDTLETTDSDDPTLPQALFPEAALPALLDTLYIRNARRISARLLGVELDDLGHWGHMISKPPGRDNPAPWHQDEAYWEPTHRYQAVGAWMPLDDVDVDNGCLWFIPGSHTGEVLGHRRIDDNPDIALLELTEPIDVSTAVPVPMRAGGASFHHPRMLHHSRPNISGGPRRAYANEFQTLPELLDPPADRPWVLETPGLFQRRMAAKLGG